CYQDNITLLRNNAGTEQTAITCCLKKASSMIDSAALDPSNTSKPSIAVEATSSDTTRGALQPYSVAHVSASSSGTIQPMSVAKPAQSSWWCTRRACMFGNSKCIASSATTPTGRFT